MSNKPLDNLLEKAKATRKGIRALKNVAVTCQDFEAAAAIREIEKELYPQSAEEKKAIEDAKLYAGALRMCGLNVADHQIWLLAEVIMVAKKKKGKFSIDDAAKLEVKQKEYFNL